MSQSLKDFVLRVPARLSASLSLSIFSSNPLAKSWDLACFDLFRLPTSAQQRPFVTSANMADNVGKEQPAPQEPELPVIVDQQERSGAAGTLPEGIEDGGHRTCNPMSEEDLNVQLGPWEAHPTLPELLALWQVANSCDAKILYDIRLAFGFTENGHVQKIFQRCAYIVIDGNPRVVYPILRYPHPRPYQNQGELHKNASEEASSKPLGCMAIVSGDDHVTSDVHEVVVDRADEGPSSKSLESWVIFSRDDNISSAVHEVVIDRVGRVHDVCLASLLDERYFSARLGCEVKEKTTTIEDTTAIEETTTVEQTTQILEIINAEEAVKVDETTNVEEAPTVEETTNVLKLPDWCSFYDGYYALHKTTRESRYPNAGQVWIAKVNGVTHWEPRFGESPTSFGTVQYACRRFMKSRGEKLNVHVDGVPSFSVWYCKNLQLSVEQVEQHNHNAERVLPPRKLTDIAEVCMVTIKVKNSRARHSVSIAKNPLRWAAGLGRWFSKKILGKD
ncbi:uncharacterized protein PAC_13315 [Phialocephala subalpina]|uniref:Uncharacterized protein n=1 Tax=Phialocephala subalpina TaxID=576137 RepID=A0A1L7XEH8_9HELO|nr:uncharacterized protein PAC_13315 [Phialocephala subalpina]